jgi:CRP-like cAMP-binding protein
VAVQCSADSFVVNQTLVLRINICSENRHLRQVQKRWLQPYRNTLTSKSFRQNIMTTQEILTSLGHFSNLDTELFEKHSTKKILNRNEVLLNEGEVCKCFYFILSGSFFQFQAYEIDEVIIDLHLQNEWMFNQQSLTEQTVSNTTIKAFSKSEVIELSLNSFHCLCSKSQSFLQFGKILNQSKNRTFIFDNSLNPNEKYSYINKSKPLLTKVFPIKMIASYLKIAPETLSRVRANY